MKLVPVYDPQGLFRVWPVMTVGVEKIASIGHDCSVEYVFNELCAGRMLAWIVADNDAYWGFAITQIINTPPKGRYLLLYQVFVKPGCRNVLEECGPTIENYARENQCTSISMYTRREVGFERRLTSMGWEKGLVEFRKELTQKQEV